ncbi:MAG: acyl carrier protein [Bacteroidales bacterium]|nr:acyl carrier protein [Bacteroidales bacterium]
MDRSEVVNIVNDFLIEEFEIDESVISEDAKFIDDLDIDSLDFVDIVVIVEKNFGFKLTAEDLSKMPDLKSFYDFITERVNQ